MVLFSTRANICYHNYGIYSSNCLRPLGAILRCELFLQYPFSNSSLYILWVLSN
jgi:hypothetical protein